MIMICKALVQTVVDIIHERNPASLHHRGANSAFEILDADSMLQLGMVVDVCEIVVRYIRRLDT